MNTFSQRRSCFRQTAGSIKPNPSVTRRLRVSQFEFPLIEITEDSAEYTFIVPLAGIDPRRIYVFARPRSLLIEIRLKNSVCHELVRASVMESIDRRIARELTLPINIEHGTTRVCVNGEFLHITARKSEHEQSRAWSELIHFELAMPGLEHLSTGPCANDSPRESI